MLRFKIIFLILIISRITITAITQQRPDLLIYQKDTIKATCNPGIYRYSYPSEHLTLNPKISNRDFYDAEVRSSTGCHRNCIGLWEIKNDSLFLVEIRSCNYRNDSIKANLKTIFGSDFKNGKVHVDWLSFNILGIKGKLLYLNPKDYSTPVYKKEVVFEIESGKVIKQYEYDNSKANLKAPEIKKSLLKIFKENQQFSIQTIEFTVDIRADSKPRIKLNSKHKKQTKKLILKVLAKINDWGTFYTRGKPVDYIYEYELFKYDYDLK